MQCPICDNKGKNREFTAKEMMIGMEDTFQYLECGNCGCLWIKEVPINIAKYYPKNYYSYTKKSSSDLEKFIKRNISLARLNKNSYLGNLLMPLYPGYLKWLDFCEINFKTKILDVGSGAGRLLLEMREFGFKNLSGIDPFLEKDIHHNAEVKVYKKSLDDVIEHYDFIMLHHSFEHMSDPQAALKKIKSVLKPNGQVLIRIPLADSYAYEKYGVNWVELDPPRHFFLHTKKSMQLMIEEQGFKLDRILYDSSNFEIIESEKWKRGIPSAKKEAIFSKKEKREMSELVDELNQKEKGSRACFYLSHG